MNVFSTSLAICGSSPLTRGKQALRRRSSSRLRLIPAHAGKTLWPDGVPRGLEAHPRSRGENYNTEIELIPGYGSSPLTRGKLGGRRTATFTAGLIPAHAGKTLQVTDRGAQPPAHPRSRGENIIFVSRFRLVGGSSPLTRGKQHDLATQQAPTGLIPAHAGKTGFAVRVAVG